MEINKEIDLCRAIFMSNTLTCADLYFFIFISVSNEWFSPSYAYEFESSQQTKNKEKRIGTSVTLNHLIVVVIELSWRWQKQFRWYIKSKSSASSSKINTRRTLCIGDSTFLGVNFSTKAFDTVDRLLKILLQKKMNDFVSIPWNVKWKRKHEIWLWNIHFLCDKQKQN